VGNQRVVLGSPIKRNPSNDDQQSANCDQQRRIGHRQIRAEVNAEKVKIENIGRMLYCRLAEPFLDGHELFFGPDFRHHPDSDGVGMIRPGLTNIGGHRRHFLVIQPFLPTGHRVGAFPAK